MFTHTPHEAQWESLQPVTFWSELMRVATFADTVVLILRAGVCSHVRLLQFNAIVGVLKMTVVPNFITTYLNNEGEQLTC